MRLLIVGAGATGGYFGGRLAQAGRDVTFLVRAARAAQLRAEGLQILSPHGDAKLTPRVVTADAVEGAYDAVLLTVKGFALENVLDDVAPAVGPSTVIVPVLNGLRHINMLQARFGEQPILGGVCLVATQIDAQGRIVQLADMQELIYGELSGAASIRVAALDETMQGAGFKARVSGHIVQDMWEKWVFLATIGGITCLMRGTIGDIAVAPGGPEMALQLLAECGAVATASGHPPGEASLARTSAAVTAAGSALASSMFRDLQQGRPVEVDQILGDLLTRAATLGVATPMLASAVVHLSIYQAKRTA